MPQLRISKFGIGENIMLKHSNTFCKTGKIIAIKIQYTVKQDDGMAFVYDEDNLIDCVQRIRK